MGKKESGVASIVALAANGEVKKKKKKKKVKDADKAVAASVAKVGGSNWAALSTVSTRRERLTFPESHAPPGAPEERRGVDLGRRSLHNFSLTSTSSHPKSAENRRGQEPKGEAQARGARGGGGGGRAHRPPSLHPCGPDKAEEADAHGQEHGSDGHHRDGL